MDTQVEQSRRVGRWVSFGVCAILVFVVTMVGVLYAHKRDPLHKWVKGQEYGRIVHVGSDSLSLVRVDGTVRVVHTTPKTRVFFGKHIIPSHTARVGDFAMVAGSATGSSVLMEARTIRIFPSHP